MQLVPNLLLAVELFIMSMAATGLQQLGAGQEFCSVTKELPPYTDAVLKFQEKGCDSTKLRRCRRDREHAAISAKGTKQNV